MNSVINLNIPNETIVSRISKRWIHPASGRIYSYDYNPPKKEGYDDDTGDMLVQRADDQADAVRTRLLNYDKMTAPLISHYSKVSPFESLFIYFVVVKFDDLK